jgi:hypothetical protein
MQAPDPAKALLAGKEHIFHMQIMQSTELTCSLCPVEKIANTGDKTELLHFSVLRVRLIVNTVTALTASKHSLIAHQSPDGRRAGSLEMILR